MSVQFLAILAVVSPLIGSLFAGLFCRKISQRSVNIVTIGLMILATLASFYLAYEVIGNGSLYQSFVLAYPDHTFNLYVWGSTLDLNLNVGFIIDPLTVYMMMIITFVSTLVHIYSIGYMHKDKGYARFFSYISGFSFAMLCLVMGNNFLMLFFGWEGVGLFSYLLIGFWFDKPSATYASLKAFIVNRVGDLGFLLGIAVVLFYFNSLDYTTAFKSVDHLYAQDPTITFLGFQFNGITLMCLLLFVGACGKSAQIPLHMWLEGSMEGPTPISALIHAATMVTAGIFMLARLSPLFELSEAALSVVLIVGASTCFFMGLLAIVQMDIKRVVAYSTLSQLGYMIAAQGASAYSIGMFHLMTHAAFKALLFLAAGSVIIAMHHEQNMSKMGGMRRYMPVTYICMLIGALALAAIPPFAGFYSKDLIIDAVSASTIYGHGYASFLVTACAFVTAFYTFRMFFYVFHGKERIPTELKSHVKESPKSVLIALIFLAIPSILAGYFFFDYALHPQSFFGSTLDMSQFPVVKELAEEAQNQSPFIFLTHAVHTLPFWLSIFGVILAYVCYVLVPSIPMKITNFPLFKPLYWFFLKKYLVDVIFDNLFGRGTWLLGMLLWRVGDVLIIDRGVVHGASGFFYWGGGKIRRLQSGFLYHYVFLMMIALVALLSWMYFIK
ncbi:NADH-quinone oxidoreductase subunit L [Thiotrichales bacterium 19S9-12]|nr:NADH-quinone oxidoreductase subunit L [Thiotrichales bacterium 19S9-11]MCF6810946.1 NADH-quinone oxidoreductase subunit L [Thiotrichales bacterium 19S9-12]